MGFGGGDTIDICVDSPLHPSKIPAKEPQHSHASKLGALKTDWTKKNKRFRIVELNES
jgi:hypothetical protein